MQRRSCREFGVAEVVVGAPLREDILGVVRHLRGLGCSECCWYPVYKRDLARVRFPVIAKSSRMYQYPIYEGRFMFKNACPGGFGFAPLSFFSPDPGGLTCGTVLAEVRSHRGRRKRVVCRRRGVFLFVVGSECDFRIAAMLRLYG